MTSRSTRKVAYLDRCVKWFSCSARNHPKGWAWWKRKNRRDIRRKLKPTKGD